MKTKERKKGINGKKKGSIFELKLAKQIAEKLNIEYGKYIRRTPGSGSLLTRSDLWVDEKYRHNFPWFLEAKKRATATLDKCNSDNWEVYNWYKESKDKIQHDPSYPIDSPALLVFANNNVGPFVMIGSADYMKYVAHNFTLHPVDLFNMYVPKYDVHILLWEDFLKL